MAKLTREQVNKINSKMENGFRLDLRYFCIWNEKTAIKYIKTGSDNENDYYLSAKIHYVDIAPAWAPEKEYNLELLMEVWKAPKDRDCMVSSSRKKYTISNGHKKKMFSLIQETTKNFPDNEVLKIFDESNYYKFLGEL